MYVLDRVMSPLQDASTTTGPLTTPIVPTVTSSVTTTLTATASSSLASRNSAAQVTSAVIALQYLWQWGTQALLVGTLKRRFA
ncbi:hypothetical protein BP5796_04474 [Coleophoma crateriformis]|uniref:Uncharacterized protein n=1 Tax=Coleophoma crateriformis TaxID=565419 RepID=A0A3D8S9N4_9HELO|nr:hypothetical protein BP5796_04474 [Coleophoma crateriformis]